MGTGLSFQGLREVVGRLRGRGGDLEDWKGGFQKEARPRRERQPERGGILGRGIDSSGDWGFERAVKAGKDDRCSDGGGGYRRPGN